MCANRNPKQAFNFWDLRHQIASFRISQLLKVKCGHSDPHDNVSCPKPPYSSKRHRCGFKIQTITTTLRSNAGTQHPRRYLVQPTGDEILASPCPCLWRFSTSRLFTSTTKIQWTAVCLVSRCPGYSAHKNTARRSTMDNQRNS